MRKGDYRLCEERDSMKETSWVVFYEPGGLALLASMCRNLLMSVHDSWVLWHSVFCIHNYHNLMHKNEVLVMR